MRIRKATLAAIAGTVLFATVGTALPAAAAQTPQYCALVRSSSTCVDTFRALVARVSGVKDAPLTPPARGSRAMNGLLARIDDSSGVVSGLFFTGDDWATSDVLAVMEGGCSSPSGGNWGFPKVKDLSTVFSGKFDNRVKSGIGFNNCQMTFFQHPVFQGASATAENAGQELDVTSIRGFYKPKTIAEGVKACGDGTATCTFTAQGKTLGKGPATLIAEVNNCSSVEQQQSMTWANTQETSLSAGGEAGATVSVEAGLGDAFKLGASLSLKATWGKTLTDSETYSSSYWLRIAPGKKGMLWLSPPVEVYSGTASVQFRDSGYIMAVPYTITQPIPTPEGQGATFSDRILTPAELASPIECPRGSQGLQGELNRTK
ncbi:hypothetical protein [Streptomyces sp. NBC_01264]|uniref:hypothetical protein n=1 Tax=Streptomyces sp. NBC_01264 TaxID=2903804 RepID=UPI0022543328|nr:hypothetical protein [Streptomyces sp. NBC_01264]MCX4783627.1 hypothetical protein [Streptomyces sp. NBC_01264]